MIFNGDWRFVVRYFSRLVLDDCSVELFERFQVHMRHIHVNCLIYLLFWLSERSIEDMFGRSKAQMERRVGVIYSGHKQLHGPYATVRSPEVCVVPSDLQQPDRTLAALGMLIDAEGPELRERVGDPDILPFFPLFPYFSTLVHSPD